MLKYFIKDKEKINYYFNTIFNQNYFRARTINIHKNKKKMIKEKKEKIISNDEKMKKTKVKSSINIHKKRQKHNDIIKSVPPKKHKISKFLKHIKTKEKHNENQSSTKILKAKSLIINNLFLNKNSNTEMNASLTKAKLKNKNLIKKKTFNNSIIKKNLFLNDYEINTLNYKDAIKLDKRTYFEYYFSLLKRKHIILFAFVPNNDYNLASIKISLFILSLSWYFTINALFFTDDTMHNIYSNNGEFIIFNQLPKILYSAFISLTLQKILKLLCISEYDILKIKKEKKLVIAKKKSKDTIKCLYIKFLIFFILGFCLMTYFWYFITCFCAVYTNTQIILFKDILISYGISMIYPFIINLFPGIFRISALKAVKKDKEFVYKIGTFVALI
jgi:hypothetical protein